ncbi:MAG: ABC transporter ATP-binding protein [Phycisphaerales bacterium]
MPEDHSESLHEAPPAPADSGHDPGQRTGGHRIVRFEDVHKSFGNLVVLSGVSVGFEEGRTAVVMGPSGTGKSVLLKHIVGLLRPDKGSVWFDAARVDTLNEDGLAPVRRQIGFVFQLSALFDSMTIRDNLAFPLVEHMDLSDDEMSDRAEEALRMVDLAGVGGKRPAELSGGQQRRVAFARAIMLRPRVMLYDEPTTGLDPVRADGICQLILKLQAELGVTGICVTHDLVSARKIADRVVMLGGGRIIADGPFEAIEKSDDEHVQNFLRGHYEPEEEPRYMKKQPRARARAAPANTGEPS